MKKVTRIITSIVLVFLLFFVHTSPDHAASSFLPLPYEDSDLGRNSNAYLSTKGDLTQKEQEAFVREVSGFALEAQAKWGIPASAIIGMAIVESGYGTTRIAQHANNIFGIKAWGYNPDNAWQLKGQPDEDFERAIPVVANYGDDRVVYDETQRRDNWYRMFPSYEEAVNFLAGNLLLNQRYGFARDNYEHRLQSGWSYEQASREFIYEIANAGYNHLGGEYYRNAVGTVMTRWNLHQYDETGFKDIRGLWAEDHILFMSDKGWMNGYPDRTFRPNENLTRAQAATVMNNFLDLTPTSSTIQFDDVPNDFWALDQITKIAQHGIMNGIGNDLFSPNSHMTRAQMAQIFYNAGFYSGAEEGVVNSFSDVAHDHWARVAIETMKKAGIMGGYGDGSFRPNEPITRAQMAAVIHRIYENDLTN